ncbi:substrate-binding domain-containing protein [Vibrio sp. OCN044]|uniref:Autoinducer 2-binding periplasmic protein LuxP n=1 Tax=Vibrio tetraodonis subsp. pristinus TaxID=2695891 RepID=A0A6L8LQZ3_9VIBR|nr:substrate-binding domain-containing protein [Vibrio tetraodonis]MYM58504.1 substrate-binding domain-containing protein [Vibrio tetraodonis subsp. pristinus]
MLGMKFAAVLCLSLFMVKTVGAKQYKFAVVPKEENNPFFQASREGCEAAAKELGNVECIFRGPKGVDVRKQDKIIAELVAEGVDGIAIAVAQSAFILDNSMKKALSAGIPIVTYDSDFETEAVNRNPNLRAAYIGTNDFELGKALGEALKAEMPNGGKVIIQSGRSDSPNLNLRVMGVRSALSGREYEHSPGKRLMGEAGWTEPTKPLYNFGSFEQALEDLKNVLNSYKQRDIHAVVAVGGWSQFLTTYRNVVEPYKQAISDKEIIIITADTADEQLVYLKDGLAHANVGQNPFEMGRQAILTLYKLATKKPVEEIQYIPMTYCTQENYQTCTKN